MPQHWETLKTCYLKDASHEKSYILWFHLYEMSRTGNPIETDELLLVVDFLVILRLLTLWSIEAGQESAGMEVLLGEWTCSKIKL